MQGSTHDLLAQMESSQVLSQTILRLLLAAALGGVIGLERELSHKSAGLRTNMFICFGAALFTICSMNLVDPSVTDRTRIASNIVQGIGFIGAGSILHQKGSIQGLTTAATLWVVAAIGMASGGGLYLQATFATVVILLSLQLLGWMEARFNIKPLYMTYDVSGANGDAMVAEIDRLLDEDRHIPESLQVSKTNSHYQVHFSVNLTHREHLDLKEKLRKSSEFSRVAFMSERE